MREPMEFESLAHLSRWRRLVIWLFEDKVGYGITSVVFASLLFGPVFVFGWWWVAVITGTLLGFFAGYRLARSFATSGQLPPEI